MKKIGILLIVALCTFTEACRKPQSLPADARITGLASTGMAEAQAFNDTSNIMVGVFWPPPLEYVNDLQFQRLGNAGVDILQYVLTYTESQNLTILNKSQANNLRSIIFDARVYGNDSDIAGMVSAYSTHPGLGGYYIKDEPLPAILDSMARIYRKILSYDPVHIPHVNLLPSIYTGFSGVNYETTYMQRWIDSVGSTNLKHLSTDIYPFLANGTFDDRYYPELERLRRVGLANSNVKTSAYLQSVGIAGGYRRPNASELKYNVYSTLAYGIKYPVWFTYFTPANYTGTTFTDAILTITGDTTDLFSPFVNLNKEMKNLGKRLSKLTVYNVYHSGPNIPTGAELVPTSFYIKPTNNTNDLIITNAKNWYEGVGRNYSMVVNKSFTQSKTITFNIAGWITWMGEISKTNGNESQLPVTNGQITLTFAPGEGRLFCFNPY